MMTKEMERLDIENVHRSCSSVRSIFNVVAGIELIERTKIVDPDHRGCLTDINL